MISGFSNFSYSFQLCRLVIIGTFRLERKDIKETYYSLYRYPYTPLVTKVFCETKWKYLRVRC